jgi:WD40 repeat protein
VRPNRLFVVLLLLVRATGAPGQELSERGTFKGHTFAVDRAELSPDGKILAAGGGNAHDGELNLWDVVTGKKIVSLPGYTNSLYSLVFSADGKRLASGSLYTLQVWDLKTHKAIASFKELSQVATITFNRDGTRLAAVAWRQVRMWEVGSGKELAAFQHRVPLGGSLGAAFTSDLATLAVRNYQEIDLWDTATSKEKDPLSEHRGEVGCMIWSADDKTVIASSTRGVGDYKKKGDVKLWDVASRKERATLPGPFGGIVAMALSADGKTLALLDSPELDVESELKLVDVDTGRQQVLPARPGYSFHSLRFTTQGKLMVVGARADTVRLWEVSLAKKDMKPTRSK